MRFWDSSALVPLVYEEQRSRACRALLRGHSDVVVWAFTRLEMLSAVRRKVREGGIDREDLAAILTRIGSLASRWTEVEPVAEVRERAEQVLARHPLSAADSLQLAAALTVVDGRPRGDVFISADDRLARAAESEGFQTVVPSR